MEKKTLFVDFLALWINTTYLRKDVRRCWCGVHYSESDAWNIEKKIVFLVLSIVLNYKYQKTGHLYLYILPLVWENISIEANPVYSDMKVKSRIDLHKYVRNVYLDLNRNVYSSPRYWINIFAMKYHSALVCISYSPPDRTPPCRSWTQEKRFTGHWGRVAEKEGQSDWHSEQFERTGQQNSRYVQNDGLYFGAFIHTNELVVAAFSRKSLNESMQA